MSNTAVTTAPQRTFLGHPVGLYVLFFSEMWERFSFYGMRAMLILYMVDYFKWSQRDASAVYKWYTSLVYLTPLLGGFLADRYLGNKWAVFIGSILMAIGQFLLTFEDHTIFFLALGFMIFGNGFFKPNISTQVGRLYPRNDPRRDGAYTIFYMGINLGAALAPFVCGLLAANTIGGRHTGFMAAGIGMLLGLLVYLVGQRWVIELKPAVEAAPSPGQATSAPAVLSEEKAEQTPSAAPALNHLAPTLMFAAGGILLLVALIPGAIRGIVALMASGGSATPGILTKLSLADHIATNTLFSIGIVALCALIAGWILTKSRQAMRDRVLTIYVLGIFVVFFWAAFEQAGNTMSIWADKATNRYLTEKAPPPPIYPEVPQVSTAENEQQSQEATVARPTGWTRWITMWQLKPKSKADSSKESGFFAWVHSLWNPVPTELFQSINAAAIIIIAPFFAWMWTSLARKGLNPSIPAKMTLGLALMSLAFVPMLIAAQRENQPTNLTYDGSLPSQIKLDASNRLCAEENGELKPYQFGRLAYNATDRNLSMYGVLANTERDRMVRDTAPESFVKAVKDLQKQSQEAKGNRFKVSVTLDPVPPGFDMRYAGLPQDRVSYDASSHVLTARDVRLADKDVKSLLVAAGEPKFRDAMNQLFQESARYRVSPMWLIWYYVIGTLAELCLSPIGLSMASKLAPARFATMLMGLWLLTNFLGNFVAGAFGERWGEWTPTEFFAYLMAIVGIAALVLFLFVGKVRAMMHGVR